FLFAVLVLGLNSCNQASKDTSAETNLVDTESFIKNVDSPTFKNLTESGNGIVLDVRTMGEFTQGHIPDAVIADIYQRDFIDKINQLPKDKEIYVYCTVGARSLQAAQILQKNGFPKVYNLQGGIMDWSRNRYPILR
ncbi:MAG: rhodanese-like domain-containing protein, partial [Cyclobacteriaceae bacterium]|nr:rhodanese-like domain-containing protein [Cyclobacteriaceae bacterium]